MGDMWKSLLHNVRPSLEVLCLYGSVTRLVLLVAVLVLDAIHTYDIKANTTRMKIAYVKLFVVVVFAGAD